MKDGVVDKIKLVWLEIDTDLEDQDLELFNQ